MALLPRSLPGWQTIRCAAGSLPPSPVSTQNAAGMCCSHIRDRSGIECTREIPECPDACGGAGCASACTCTEAGCRLPRAYPAPAAAPEDDSFAGNLSFPTRNVRVPVHRPPTASGTRQLNCRTNAWTGSATCARCVYVKGSSASMGTWNYGIITLIHALLWNYNIDTCALAHRPLQAQAERKPMHSPACTLSSTTAEMGSQRLVSVSRASRSMMLPSSVH